MPVTATPRPKGQTMRRVPESAEAARRLVRTALAAWGQEDLDALTERWGADLYRWGKQVWGEMKCEGAG